MTSDMTRGDILKYLLDKCYFKNVEEITLKGPNDHFSVIDPENHNLLYRSEWHNGIVSECKDNYKNIPCYKYALNSEEPCYDCPLNSANNNSSDHFIRASEQEDSLLFSRGRFSVEKGKTVYRDLVRELPDFKDLENIFQSALEARNMLMGCLQILASETMLDSVKFDTLLQYCAKYFKASSGYLLLYGEFQSVFTYNYPKDNPDAIPRPQDFPVALRKEMEEILSPHSVCFFHADEQSKKATPEIFEYVTGWGLRSVLLVPVYHKESILKGFFVLHNVKEHFSEIDVLWSIGDMIANLYAEIDERIINAKKLYTDATTGFYNLTGFKNEMNRIMKRNTDQTYLLWSLDVKDFSYLVEIFGYEDGDDLLKTWAQAMNKFNNTDEFIGRVNADNLVTFQRYTSMEKIQEDFSIMVNYLKEYCRKYISESFNLVINAGICIVEPNSELSLNEIMDRAHVARIAGKNKAESVLNIYDDDMHQSRRFNKELELAVDSAISNGNIVPFFQPQLCLSDNAKGHGQIRAEALARWMGDDGSIYARPDQFIPILENTGQIVEVDQAIYESVCQTISDLKQKGIKTRISVNVSRFSLFRPGFVECYEAIRRKHGIGYDEIILEFTESISVNDIDKFVEITNQLKELGFVCSMDDFGSDYSSLNTLHLLDLDELKIDKAFFLNGENTIKKKVIVESILNLSESLDMETVAEGIETEETLSLLEQSGCDYIQGYIYAKPMPKKDFYLWVNQNVV